MGLISKSRCKLNRLVRSEKGYAKSVKMLKHLPSIVFEERLNQAIKSIGVAE